jgi:hypothetical protein
VKLGSETMGSLKKDAVDWRFFGEAVEADARAKVFELIRQVLQISRAG